MAVVVTYSLVCLAGLLASERLEARAGIWAFKPAASAGFVALALVGGATESLYGLLILAGLLLSAAGDVLLIPQGRTQVFQAGVFSFLCAHIVYACAFLLHATNPAIGLGAGAVTAAIALGVLSWLRPHLPDDMRIPVYAYIVVISSMLAVASSTLGGVGGTWIFAGALLFYLSDLAVARDRFVAPGFLNRAWGLPFYYVGQLVLAYTVTL